MLIGLCTGIESAQHCFVLLQNNSHFYDNQGTKISWNHIFYAFERYYDSFKTDQNQTQLNQQSTPYGYQNYGQIRSQYNYSKGITQLELQGLISVIKLVNQIAFYSEKARIALCEFQRSDSASNNVYSTMGLTNSDGNLYSLPVLMFGLLSCSIPTSLKGEILKLLGSLSLTSIIAANMWQFLENSQLISTIGVPQSVGFPQFKSDLKIELEEIESREETYPLLRGFLYFMKNLIISSKIPDNLGLGFRPANSVLGFQPFLQFLVHNVYLKIFYRSYKNISEKWQITEEILEIFYILISKYNINKDDFQNALYQTTDILQINTFKSPVSNSPGYRLIYDFIHDGPIIRMLFSILNESLNHLLEYDLNKSTHINASSLMSLKIISLVIQKQKLFIEQMKIANLSIDCTGIEKLIITINPKSNRADYLMCILRFVQFNSSLVQHSYHALNIMYMLSNYSLINTQFLNLFMKSCLSLTEQCELTNSFVEFLEYDEFDVPAKDDLLDITSRHCLETINAEDFNDHFIDEFRNENVDLREIRSTNRLVALKLILYYLKLQAPNIAHLLLGFDIHKPLKNQYFYNPGTKINYNPNDRLFLNNGYKEAEGEILSIVPRNCLHSIIRILNKFLKEPKIAFTLANTIDSCYEILYILCSNFQYNQQMLNYLRTEFDFVNNNLKSIPFKFDQTEFGDFEIKENFNSSSLGMSRVKQENIDRSIHADKAMETPITLYSNYSWIIKLACLEIQSLISNRMKTKLKKTIQLLIENNFNIDYTGSSKNASFLIEQKQSKIFSNSHFDNLVYNSSASNKKKLANITNCDLFENSTFDREFNTENDFSEKFNKVNCLLSDTILVQSSPEQLVLNFFDNQLIEKLIDNCKYTTESFTANLQLYDTKKIKEILLNEIKDSGINISKHSLVIEIQNILQNVHERNRFQLNFFIKRNFLDSLKTLVETVILLTPLDVFLMTQRYKFLTGLTNRLFQIIKFEDLITELTYPVASILFTLIANLRQVISQIKKQQISEALALNQKPQDALNLSDLFDIFKKTIEYLLNSCKLFCLFCLFMHT